MRHRQTKGGLRVCSTYRHRATSRLYATLSSPRVPAKVPSPSDLPTFVIVHLPTAVLLSYGLCPGKPPKGKLDGGEGHEGDQGFDEVLEVLGQTPVSSEPGAGVQATDVVLSYGDNQITNGQQLL